ncbi:hypothetical protein EVAR_66861_1 [Eumeta japonica]|uniref:Uncharacterized protein n=1 Tax=Eumeta variegata TaxID=151549 RepID=A0A4C1ZNC0_EUMVA|nr:hypothetical protein EVAR_66861_1 [Eumeta japonica]
MSCSRRLHFDQAVRRAATKNELVRSAAVRNRSRRAVEITCREPCVFLGDVFAEAQSVRATDNYFTKSPTGRARPPGAVSERRVLK